MRKMFTYGNIKLYESHEITVHYHKEYYYGDSKPVICYIHVVIYIDRLRKHKISSSDHITDSYLNSTVTRVYLHNLHYSEKAAESRQRNELE